ncbi:hypothetical protein RRG08_036691 [Elysia crispata]|uniref:Uncharacterized protein n=1 Tax=Elysia crispata TaxID=231223 RepID=A0AAE1DXD9_9GAST|nr:hypothetical protein RRG08_036691 [Elysia crispata]
MKRVRTQVCPERDGCIPVKHHYGNSKLNYCQQCLNTNVVNVDTVDKLVKTIINDNNSCHVCGKLDIDLDVPMKNHLDSHVQAAARAVSTRNIFMNNKEAVENMCQLTYNLYKKANNHDERVAPCFKWMSERDKTTYVQQASTIVDEDTMYTDNTAFTGKVDNRPTLNIYQLGSPFHPPNVKLNHMDVEMYMSFEYLKREQRIKREGHTVFLRDIKPCMDSDWGNHSYVCHTCNVEFKITMTGDYSEEPLLVNTVVCTCSHKKDENNGSLHKSSHSEDNNTTRTGPGSQIVFDADCTDVYGLDDTTPRHYLYIKKCGYVIHRSCCKMN